MVCEGHRRRLTPPGNLWLVCEESVARVRANVGGMPPTPPFRRGGNSCFHTPACVPARSVDWENRVGRKNYSGVKGITRLRRVLCPATPDAYFNWIPASLHCSSPPPSAEMMNSSGENDGCLCFHHCSALASCSAELPAIPGDNLSFLQKPPSPSSSPAGGDPAAVTVIRTITFELGNRIAETNR